MRLFLFAHFKVEINRSMNTVYRYRLGFNMKRVRHRSVDRITAISHENFMYYCAHCFWNKFQLKFRRCIYGFHTEIITVRYNVQLVYMHDGITTNHVRELFSVFGLLLFWILLGFGMALRWFLLLLLLFPLLLCCDGGEMVVLLLLFLDHALFSHSKTLRWCYLIKI